MVWAMTLAEVLHENGEPWVPMDTFGTRLAIVRQHMGWNTAEAGEACGVNDQTWRNWEAGRSPRKFEDVCHKIADASGCSYLWLMAGDVAVPRSRCFSPDLALVPALDAQLELDFDPPARDHLRVVRT